MMQVQARQATKPHPNSPRTAGKGPPRPQRGLLAPYLLQASKCLPGGQSPWRHRLATRWQVGCRVLTQNPSQQASVSTRTLMPVGFADK